MTLSRFLLLLFVIALLGAISFFAYVGYESVTTWNQTYERAEMAESEPDLPESSKNLISILVLGIDREGYEEDDQYGRSDAIVLVLLNTKTGKITALSIPRDTRVELLPDQYDKLTHAYSYGPEVSISTIENLLQFPIDYFMAFNYTAFEDFIDIIGGIEVDAERSMEVGDQFIERGPQQMDGKTALNYVRFRKDDEGDFGRMRRQRQIIDAVMQHMLNPETAANINRFFTLAEENIRHNIPLDSLWNRTADLTSLSPDDFKKMSLKGINAEIDSLWYVILRTEDLTRTRDSLRSELQNAQ